MAACGKRGDFVNQCKEWAVSLSLGEGVGLLADMPNEFQCQLSWAWQQILNNIRVIKCWLIRYNIYILTYLVYFMISGCSEVGYECGR